MGLRIGLGIKLAQRLLMVLSMGWGIGVGYRCTGHVVEAKHGVRANISK